jgi:hypothetical protein
MLQGATIYSAIDIKSGFFNVAMHEDSYKYLGVVTQDGLFFFVRLPFGLLLAPAYFQAVMNLAIQAARHPIHAGVYLDDVTITGTCLR